MALADVFRPARQLEGAAVWAHGLYAAAVTTVPWAWPRLLPHGMPRLQVADFLIAAAVGMTMVAVATRRLAWKPGWFDGALGAYFVWSVASWAVNSARPAALMDLAAHAELCCFAWCTGVLSGSSRQELEKITGVWVVSAAVAGAAAVVGALLWVASVPTPFSAFLGDLPFAWPRTGGPTRHPNVLANLSLAAFVLLCVCPRRLRDVLGPGRTGFVAAMAAVGAGLILSLSRALVTALVAALWWVLTRFKVRVALRLAVVGMVALCGVVGIFCLSARPPPIRIFRKAGLRSDPSGVGIRHRIFKKGVAMACRRPLWGYGPGSRPVQVPYWNGREFMRRSMDGHNVFLNVTLKLGLAGLAAFLAVALFAAVPRPGIGSFAALRWTTPDGLRAGLLFCLAALMLTGFHIDLEDLRHFWAVAGLVHGAGLVRALPGAAGNALAPQSATACDHTRRAPQS